MTSAQLELLAAADAICRRYPASVTSWWRSARHNASLPGSVPNSQHQQGLAIDLVFDGPEPSRGELAGFLSPTMQDVRSEPGHVHLEQDPTLLARAQGRGAGTRAASATRSPSPSIPSPSPSTSSTSSSALASSSAPAASATSRGGPGSSPVDKLFRGKS